MIYIPGNEASLMPPSFTS